MWMRKRGGITGAIHRSRQSSRRESHPFHLLGTRSRQTINIQSHSSATAAIPLRPARATKLFPKSTSRQPRTIKSILMDTSLGWGIVKALANKLQVIQGNIQCHHSQIDQQNHLGRNQIIKVVFLRIFPLIWQKDPQQHSETNSQIHHLFPKWKSSSVSAALKHSNARIVCGSIRLWSMRRVWLEKLRESWQVYPL